MNASDTKKEQKGREQDGPPAALKAVVIGMGVLLVVGTITLFVLLALGVHKKDRPAQAAANGCAPQEWLLEAGEYLDDYEVEGDIVTIYSERGDGEYRIRRVHLCNGELLQQLTIQEQD